MTTRYFAGNSLASCFRNNSSVVESTSGGTFDSAFVPNSIAVPSGLRAITSPFSATGTVWIHFEGVINLNTSADMAVARNGLTDYYRLHNSIGGPCTMQYWNGSAWVSVGSGFTISSGVRTRFDWQIVLGTSMSMYMGGTLTDTGASGGSGTMTDFVMVGGGGTTNYFSQILIGDFDTRDSRYMQSLFNGNSATNTGGTGSYTDINEIVLDESTSESIAISGNKMGQTHASVTIPAGYIIGSAHLNGRGRVSGTITDGKLGLRSGTTNYSSAGLAYNGAYEPRSTQWLTDPDTGLAWTQTSFNAAETYLEAV